MLVRFQGSLVQTFVNVFLIVRNTFRHAFRLIVYSGVLSRMSISLDTVDIFSTVYRPRRTAHLSVSLAKQGNDYNGNRVVFHFWLCLTQEPSFNASHLLCAIAIIIKRQAAVKLHGVFVPHWESPACSPE